MSSEWHRFSRVTNHVAQPLFRSSAPNYNGEDSDQRLTKTAIQYLVDHNVTRIISVNQYSYTQDEITLLSNAGILYRHFSVPDFHAPTLQQLTEAAEFFGAASSSNSGTLVHCGYGHGRTGTVVTALQLFSTGGHNPPESEWQSVNHVEREHQLEVLRQLRARYRDEL